MQVIIATSSVCMGSTPLQKVFIKHKHLYKAKNEKNALQQSADRTLDFLMLR